MKYSPLDFNTFGLLIYLLTIKSYNLTIIITVGSCPGTCAKTLIPPVIVPTEVVYPANCAHTGVSACIKYYKEFFLLGGMLTVSILLCVWNDIISHHIILPLIVFPMF